MDWIDWTNIKYDIVGKLKPLFNKKYDIIEELKHIVEELKPLFIKSFTMFYGEEHRDKIEKIINDLIVVFIGRNMSFEDIVREQNAILCDLKKIYRC